MIQDTRFRKASSHRSSILLFLVLLPLSFCSLALLSNPLVCEDTNQGATPWFVSTQTIHFILLSFCSLPLLSNPLVCEDTNQGVRFNPEFLCSIFVPAMMFSPDGSQAPCAAYSGNYVE